MYSSASDTEGVQMCGWSWCSVFKKCFRKHTVHPAALRNAGHDGTHLLLGSRMGMHHWQGEHGDTSNNTCWYKQWYMWVQAGIHVGTSSNTCKCCTINAYMLLASDHLHGQELHGHPPSAKSSRREQLDLGRNHTAFCNTERTVGGRSEQECKALYLSLQWSCESDHSMVYTV